MIFPVRTVPTTQGHVRQKYMVVLQGGPEFAASSYVAVVIASTYDRPPEDLEGFEVLVGTTDGFHHDTVIDCHRPYTFLKADLPERDRLKNIWNAPMTLSPAVMDDVSKALVVGLQL